MPWDIMLALALLTESGQQIVFSPDGSQVSAVQWTVSLGTLTINPAVQGKTLDCGPVIDNQQTCILYGLNQISIPAGLLASSSAPVTVSQATASDPSGAAIPITALNFPPGLVAVAH